MTTRSNVEIALDAIKRVGSFSEGEKDALLKALRTSMFPGNWEIGTPDDGDTFVYNASTSTWEFNTLDVGTFLSLTDTPGSYPSGNRIVRANSAQDALEFHQPLIDDNVDVNIQAPSAGDVLTYNVGDYWENVPPQVYSVNSYTGVITLDIDDVTPTTTKGDLIVDDGTNAVRLGVGTDTHVLTLDSGETLGMKWAASPSGFADPMTTRGDIIIRNSSNTTARLGKGTAGQVLTSDGTDVAWDDSIAGVSEFIDLNDVPATYVGQANKFLRVNAGATAIEFTSATPVTQVTGTSPVVSSGGTTPAISIPAATASVNGYMTSTFAAKLNGIESGADVTDATNVAAAGAYMKTVTISTSAPSGGSDGDVWYQVV